MDDIYERFSELLKAKCLKVSDICKITGISSGTMTDWKKGRYIPKADKIRKIADALDTSVEYLMNGSEKEKPVIVDDDEQKKVLEMFNSASPEIRAAVLAVLKSGVS